jgi:hypothetical protein
MQILTEFAGDANLTGMSARNERLSETLAFRVPGRVYEVVKELAERERRKMSEVELAIFERGLAAYQRDGLLFEPTKTDPQERPSKLPTGKRSIG